MRKMRTAEEMREYYRENKGPELKSFFFVDLFDRDSLQYYKKAEVLLDPDEYVFMLFWGYTYIYEAALKREERIYLLTNKQVITKCVNEIGWRTIDYARLKNITVDPTGGIEIFFDTDGWYRDFSDVRLQPGDVEFVKRELAEVMPYIREIQAKEAQQKRFSGSPADEIRKFKELWDDGIITEEEFEDRKRELLKFKYMD